MRGVDKRDNAIKTSSDGSPPHAWGRCFVNPVDVLTNTVHPHMRGVDVFILWAMLILNRFTPTCVG